MKHESTNEPVAWITNNGDGWLRWHRAADNNLNSIPLYTHPQDQKKDEALRLALEALKANQPINYCMNNTGEKFPMVNEDPFRFERNAKAITLIEQALEKRK